MFRRVFFATMLLFSVICTLVSGQECAPPKIIANANSVNLFTPEQEMILGDIAVQQAANGIRFIHDDKLLEYINEIGQRLINHLPPTGLRFQFHIINIPENNAFNLPGGHVFISRKLIGFARNEDELAGVIAHELGHATVRHAAVGVSEDMRKLLHITSLGDRKDITEKYNLLIEKARTKNGSSSRNQMDEHQIEADKIGLFALVAAGYDASAFSAFFDRLAETQGKTGNWFSDLFGGAKPDQKRLREMIQLTGALPSACRDGRSAAKSEAFTKWQADVVSFRDTDRKEELPGLIWKKDLSQKLRTDVSHLTFSPDGKYLLLQDDFAVTIITRDNLQVLFQIPIDRAEGAAFTLDGQQVVFVTSELRFERWSLAEQKPVEIRELTTRRSCWEHALSPDGNYLGCVDTSGSINILDTKTGKKVWEKKEFYRLNYFEYITWLASRPSNPNTGLFRIVFSPDSHFAMFSRSDKFGFRFRINSMIIDETERTATAVDLATLQPIGIGGDIKKLSGHAYIFLDSGRVLGLPGSKPEDGGIFAFPSGKRMAKFPFYATEIQRTANSDYLIMKPLVNAQMGVFDLKKEIVVAALNKRDATMWNNLLVYESVSGKLLVRQVAYSEKEKTFDTKDIGLVDVPISSIRNLKTAEVSDDFNWLVFSSGTRGGLWNLKTGDRKTSLRGFKGSMISNDGKAVGDFPRYQDTKHSLVVMDPINNSADALRELPEKGAQQYGRFVLTLHSLKENVKEKDDGKESQQGSSTDEQEDLSNLRTNVRFEIRDVAADRLLWSREFPNEAPEYSLDKYSGRMIFYWQLGSDAGKARLKELPELQAKASSMDSKSDDYLVEIVDTLAQKTVGMMLVDTGRGSFDISGGRSDRDWIVFHDSAGRELVYSITEGVLRHRFFVRYAMLNPKKNQIAIENFPGEINLFDLDTGEPQSMYVVNGSASYLRFNSEGSKLFILSDSQSAYVFDLSKGR